MTFGTRGRFITLALMILAAAILAACTGTGGGQTPTEEIPTAEPTPEATVPADDGAGDPFGGATLPEFEQFVKDALAANDFEAAAQLMADPHTIGFFQSEGVTLTPIEAASQLTGTYKGESCTIQFPEMPADLSTVLGGDPLTMWNPELNMVSAIYSTGWGMACEGEALLMIAEQPDNSFRWAATLLAPDGFVPGPDGSGASGTPITNEGGYDSLEGMQQIVKDAIANNDFELLALAMDDPFHIGFWRSEGISMTPLEGGDALTSTYRSANCTITFPDVPAEVTANFTNLGFDPLARGGENAPNLVGWLYSEGWGGDCLGEGILIFSESSGVYALNSFLFAPTGFAE